jgi:thiosulfate dehydrogenase
VKRGLRAHEAALTWAAIAGLATACGDPETVEVERSAIEHGRALLVDPTLGGGSSDNRLACATCHAERADEASARLPGAPLAGAIARPSYWGGAELTLLGAINQCRYYFMFADVPWTGDEVEARAIYAYLASIADGDTAAQPFTIGEVEVLAAGDAERGADVYAAACASCHGDAYTGLTGGTLRDVPSAPVLPQQTLAEHPLSEYTPEERRLVFVEKTRHGTFFGYGGQMPPFAIERLSDADLADVLAHLGLDP